MSDEARAAIANASAQSHAQSAARFMREQFANSHMYYMQQQQQHQMMWQMQQQTQQQINQHSMQQQQQSAHDGKKSSTATATEQLEPTTKKRRRESQTDDHAEEEDFESVTYGSTIDESIIYDEVAGGDKLLPLSENPEDDRETLDWFDSSFNVA